MGVCFYISYLINTYNYNVTVMDGHVFAGWCRKKEKVEPEVVVTQPPVKPYIPRYCTRYTGRYTHYITSDTRVTPVTYTQIHQKHPLNMLNTCTLKYGISLTLNLPLKGIFNGLC